MTATTTQAPDAAAQQAKREAARATLSLHAAYMAHNARRMAERAVALGMTAAEVAALHYAGATVGEAFGFTEPPATPQAAG